MVIKSKGINSEGLTQGYPRANLTVYALSGRWCGLARYGYLGSCACSRVELTADLLQIAVISYADGYTDAKALGVDNVSASIIYGLSQPQYFDSNEILIKPRIYVG